MSDLMEQIQRERITEERVRSLDVVDIVEVIHGHEDRINELEARELGFIQSLRELEAKLAVLDTLLKEKIDE